VDPSGALLLCCTDVMDYWRDRSITLVEHYDSPGPRATLFSQCGGDGTMLTSMCRAESYGLISQIQTTGTFMFVSLNQIK